jgi:hypothetical protein
MALTGGADPTKVVEGHPGEARTGWKDRRCPARGSRSGAVPRGQEVRQERLVQNEHVEEPDDGGAPHLEPASLRKLTPRAPVHHAHDAEQERDAIGDTAVQLGRDTESRGRPGDPPALGGVARAALVPVHRVGLPDVALRGVDGSEERRSRATPPCRGVLYLEVPPRSRARWALDRREHGPADKP